jgi:hypothetical protein
LETEAEGIRIHCTTLFTVANLEAEFETVALSFLLNVTSLTRAANRLTELETETAVVLTY